MKVIKHETFDINLYRTCVNEDRFFCIWSIEITIDNSLKDIYIYSIPRYEGVNKRITVNSVLEDLYNGNYNYTTCINKESYFLYNCKIYQVLRVDTLKFLELAQEIKDPKLHELLKKL